MFSVLILYSICPVIFAMVFVVIQGYFLQLNVQGSVQRGKSYFFSDLWRPTCMYMYPIQLCTQVMQFFELSIVFTNILEKKKIPRIQPVIKFNFYCTFSQCLNYLNSSHSTLIKQALLRMLSPSSIRTCRLKEVR